MKNAPGLKPEYSNSFSTSFDGYVRLGDLQANLLLEGFYTRLSNTFVKVPTVDADGNPIEERRNGHNANVVGVNIEGKIVPLRVVQLQLGYTFQQSTYSEPQQWVDDPSISPEKRMLRTPDSYGYYTLTVEPVKHLLISATGTYTGSMLVPHLKGYIAENRLERSPQFFDAGLKASYDLELNLITLKISGGIKNIFNSYQKDFDRGADRDSGYIYGPGQPRTVFISLKIGNIGR